MIASRNARELSFPTLLPAAYRTNPAFTFHNQGGAPKLRCTHIASEQRSDLVGVIDINRLLALMPSLRSEAVLAISHLYSQAFCCRAPAQIDDNSNRSHVIRPRKTSRFVVACHLQAVPSRVWCFGWRQQCCLSKRCHQRRSPAPALHARVSWIRRDTVVARQRRSAKAVAVAQHQSSKGHVVAARESSTITTMRVAKRLVTPSAPVATTATAERRSIQRLRHRCHLHAQRLEVTQRPVSFQRLTSMSA